MITPTDLSGTCSCCVGEPVWELACDTESHCTKRWTTIKMAAVLRCGEIRFFHPWGPERVSQAHLHSKDIPPLRFLIQQGMSYTMEIWKTWRSKWRETRKHQNHEKTAVIAKGNLGKTSSLYCMTYFCSLKKYFEERGMPCQVIFCKSEAMLMHSIVMNNVILEYLGCRANGWLFTVWYKIMATYWCFHYIWDLDEFSINVNESCMPTMCSFTFMIIQYKPWFYIYISKQ